MSNYQISQDLTGSDKERITTIKAAAHERKYVLSSNTVNDIQEVKYINRHIIDNTDRFYRVHFISDEAFEEILIQYYEAAQEFVDYYMDLHSEVYGDTFNNQKSYRKGRSWSGKWNIDNRTEIIVYPLKTG